MTQAWPPSDRTELLRPEEPPQTTCAPAASPTLTCSGPASSCTAPAPSPPRGHVAGQVSLCGSQLSRWPGGSRPGLGTPATSAPTSLGPRETEGAGLQSRAFPASGAVSPHTCRRGGLRAPRQTPGPPAGDALLARVGGAGGSGKHRRVCRPSGCSQPARAATALTASSMPPAEVPGLGWGQDTSCSPQPGLRSGSLSGPRQ